MLNQKLTQNLDIVDDDRTIKNYDVKRFIFTKKTITYHGKTIQLRNVTKISKYSFKKTQEAVFSISMPTLLKSYAAFAICIALTYLLRSVETIPMFFMMGIFISGGIIFYGHYERKKKKPIDSRYFGLVIHNSSGKSENLLTQNKQFIWILFNEITKAMNDEGFSTIVANFNNHEIQYADHSTIEKIVVGDNFENITESNIVNRSTVNGKLELEQLLKDEGEN